MIKCVCRSSRVKHNCPFADEPEEDTKTQAPSQEMQASDSLQELESEETESTADPTPIDTPQITVEMLGTPDR